MTSRLATKKASYIHTEDGRVLNKSGWLKLEAAKALAEKYGWGSCVVFHGMHDQKAREAFRF